MSTSYGADQNAELLLGLSFSHNLQQVVLENTGVHDTSGSILDLVFLTEPVFSKWYTCKMSEGISDHKLITLLCDHSPLSFPMPSKTMLHDFSRTGDIDVFDYVETKLESFLSVSSESAGIDDLRLSSKAIVFYLLMILCR